MGQLNIQFIHIQDKSDFYFENPAKGLAFSKADVALRLAA